MSEESGLVDARGRPLQTHRTRISAPKVDKGFGSWAGRDSFFANLPGGGILQFDLSKLTLADFRSMRQHYQLGASLNVLTFVMHQIDWKVDCEDDEIATFIETEIRKHWTPLIFSLSQAFWAGYSPIAVNYENADGYIGIKRFKDLVPEECWPKWKVERGWAPRGKIAPKLYKYDGFYQQGHEIPPENSLWYPLLMENGDHFGRKLLRPAFPSWYFSNLMHLYANRYFERFGEPMPIGRAPFDQDVTLNDGTDVRGKVAMEQIVANIRNRAVTVLPSDRDPDSGEFEWELEYLESQMRGADFERYLGRLDEEMSLSVFTPILLFRTADVGSYNLGQAHLKIFEQMLNAIAGDQQFYIQNYLVDRLRILNFGENSPKATWSYRRLGTVDLSVYKEIVVELIRQGATKLDMDELGALIGVSMEEQELLTQDPADPEDEPDEDEPAERTLVAARRQLDAAVKRSVRESMKRDTGVEFGYRNRVKEALVQDDGWSERDAHQFVDNLYGSMNTWLDDVGGVFQDPTRMHEVMSNVLEAQLA